MWWRYGLFRWLAMVKIEFCFQHSKYLCLIWAWTAQDGQNGAPSSALWWLTLCTAPNAYKLHTLWRFPENERRIAWTIEIFFSTRWFLLTWSSARSLSFRFSNCTSCCARRCLILYRPIAHTLSRSGACPRRYRMSRETTSDRCLNILISCHWVPLCAANRSY